MANQCHRVYFFDNTDLLRPIAEINPNDFLDVQEKEYNSVKPGWLRTNVLLKWARIKSGCSADPLENRLHLMLSTVLWPLKKYPHSKRERSSNNEPFSLRACLKTHNTALQLHHLTDFSPAISGAKRASFALICCSITVLSGLEEAASNG